MAKRLEKYGKHWVGGGGHNTLNLTGLKVHALTALEKTNKRCGPSVMWRCRCVCGREDYLAPASALKAGRVQSCGCKKIELIRAKATRHGMSVNEETRLTHKIWSGMLARCRNSNSKYYKRYGGRGIAVCERWLVFENFFEDMGVAPKGMSLDRIDNDKGYSPENCRWATQIQQQRNKSSNRPLTVRGEVRPASEWAELMGMKTITLYSRLRYGWSEEDAVLTPVRAWGRNR